MAANTLMVLKSFLLRKKEKLRKLNDFCTVAVILGSCAHNCLCNILTAENKVATILYLLTVISFIQNLKTINFC
jgi:hypothetical protein